MCVTPRGVHRRRHQDSEKLRQRGEAFRGATRSGAIVIEMDQDCVHECGDSETRRISGGMPPCFVAPDRLKASMSMIVHTCVDLQTQVPYSVELKFFCPIPPTPGYGEEWHVVPSLHRFIRYSIQQKECFRATCIYARFGMHGRTMGSH